MYFHVFQYFHDIDEYPVQILHPGRRRIVWNVGVLSNEGITNGLYFFCFSAGTLFRHPSERHTFTTFNRLLWFLLHLMEVYSQNKRLGCTLGDDHYKPIVNISSVCVKKRFIKCERYSHSRSHHYRGSHHSIWMKIYGFGIICLAVFVGSRSLPKSSIRIHTESYTRDNRKSTGNDSKP